MAACVPMALPVPIYRLHPAAGSNGYASRAGLAKMNGPRGGITSLAGRSSAIREQWGWTRREAVVGLRYVHKPPEYFLEPALNRAGVPGDLLIKMTSRWLGALAGPAESKLDVSILHIFMLDVSRSHK